jgi:hypothetical protein
MYFRRLSFLFITLSFILCVKITLPAEAQVQIPGMDQRRADSCWSDGIQTPVITYKLIPGINNTWGYDILVDSRVKIHQPSIPGQPGNDGFKTREKAEKVARLVIKKMKSGESLPSITAEELKKLKAI